MRHHISFKGVDKKSKGEIKDIISKYKDQLVHILGSLKDSDVSLRGVLEKHGTRELYRFLLHLHLPRRKVLSVHEEGDNVRQVIKEAFAELERQVTRVKSRIKNEHLWKRKARRKALRYQNKGAVVEEQAPACEPTTPWDWFDQVREWLPALYDFSRREIIYLQNSDDLLPTDIQPDELVDEVLVEAYKNQDAKPEQLDLRAWLFQLAIQVLDREVEKSRNRRLAISLEEEVPDDEIDEHIYEFYQPDEVLKIEDLIGVVDHVPEEEVDTLMRMQHLAQPALAQLPHTWRRAALLHHLAELPIPDIAQILALEEQKVHDLLGLALNFVSERIRQGQVEGDVDLHLVLTTCIRCTSPASLVAEMDDKFNQ